MHAVVEVFDPRAQAPHVLFEQAKQLECNDQTCRKLMAAVLSHGEYSPNSWAQSGIVSKRFASRLNELPTLQLERIQTSQKDGFQKFLFRTQDGLPIESVAIPLHKAGSVSVCLSSQVGCVMGCVFCATARMRERRNLKTWEIVDQFIQVRRHVLDEGRRVTGAVFMGMGEPFLNYESVIAAANLFRYPVMHAIRGKAITISTVGLIQEIDRFTEENWPFRLSISLGAATDEKRERLVPIAARFPIADVLSAARRHASTRNDRVMLSYVCIGGENVSVDDARALAKCIGDIPVRLDLIDVNDSTGRFQAPSEDELRTFRSALSKYLQQPVVRRYSGGADIQAACGTLAGVSG